MKLNEKQTKSVLLSFRITPEEKARLEQKSRGYDRLSDYLRDCIFGKEIVVIEGVDRVADELRRIGNRYSVNYCGRTLGKAPFEIRLKVAVRMFREGLSGKNASLAKALFLKPDDLRLLI